MKIYIAGKWEDREKIRELMDYFEAIGHTIIRDWTIHEEHGKAKEYAIEDIEGVIECDCLVAYMVSDYNYKGAYVEIGATLALDKRVFIIGDKADSCVFSKHPNVTKVDSVEDVRV